MQSPNIEEESYFSIYVRASNLARCTFSTLEFEVNYRSTVFSSGEKNV